MFCHILGAALMLVAARADEKPKTSADVVKVRFYPGSLADGLETYYVEVKVAKGWHVYANPGGVKGGAKAEAHVTRVIEILAHGKLAGTAGYDYPKGVRKTDADGKEYFAYEGELAFQCSVVHDDVKDARVVSVKVKFVATDGKTRLPASTVTAEYK
jgi:hypothetical protein